VTVPAGPMHGDAAADLSDLIGLDAEQARRRLEIAGERVGVIVETTSPRPVVLEGSLRVVRARRRSDGQVDLVVTRERYVPPTNRE